MNLCQQMIHDRLQRVSAAFKERDSNINSADILAGTETLVKISQGLTPDVPRSDFSSSCPRAEQSFTPERFSRTPERSSPAMRAGSRSPSRAQCPAFDELDDLEDVDSQTGGHQEHATRIRPQVQLVESDPGRVSAISSENRTVLKRKMQQHQTLAPKKKQKLQWGTQIGADAKAVDKFVLEFQKE